ncbi:coiled-coil domain-containing protein 80 [Conger conger]|uniref:coiled-coil domain-containing protein 80 n=1 Tax=Conger conger TaxID=82655 RepID=UPI002A5989A9|nr:coiled-coil domain-containing protein 80 [Conger conger]
MCEGGVGRGQVSAPLLGSSRWRDPAGAEPQTEQTAALERAVGRDVRRMAALALLLFSPVRMSGVGPRAPGLMRQSVCVALLLLCSTALSEAQSPPGPERSPPPAGLEAQRRGRDAAEPSLPPELEFLAGLAGKHRLWVITAPSHADNYLRMMQKQIRDMEPEGLSCRLAERDTVIVTIVQNAMMEGRVRRPSYRGEAQEEALDSDTVTKLLHYLDLQEQEFSMLLLKKNLLVGERFPYPVRVAAILEVIDQLPARKLEKLTRKGSPERCKVVRKRVVPRKWGPARTAASSPRRRARVTAAPQHRRPLGKQAALRSQVQNILSGRSRFVIRKEPAAGRRAQPFTPEGPGPSRAPHARGDSAGSVSHEGGAQPAGGAAGASSSGVKGHTDSSGVKGHADSSGVKDHADSSGVKGHADSSGVKGHADLSKQKGKGKKKGGKKKGKGRKSQRDASGKKALKTFLEKFEGKRRLLVVSAPAKTSPAYLQQNADNQQNHCDLALRKVTTATILGPENNSTLHLYHYLQGTEPPFEAGPDTQTDLGLIALIRKEYGILPADFSLVLTDYDLKPQNLFQAPVSPSVMTDTLDSFPSREPEKRREKSRPATCPTPGAQSEVESSLLRFMSKRRLLIISTPSEDDYSFQQQLQALNGQSCNLGIRHFALLKLIGAGPQSSGSVELLPLNGKSQAELEPLSADMVEGLRGQLKITGEYFSMLVVGKDGEVKAWFPSPMWSLVNVYDLVDSMEQRQDEQRLQSTLGIRCPDDSGSSHHGYEDEGEESYLYRHPED